MQDLGWVLTGDKMETAINIGYTCNLLTKDMNLILVNGGEDPEDVDGTITQLRTALSRVSASPDYKYALVIDGRALFHALQDSHQLLLLQLALHCVSVICCRVSPLQKATVVQLVKDGLGAMCLAIGDGANDVSMIQSAQVGIGISGEEGMQAVMAADYAISEFRHLEKLLLVHGHWSYMRTSNMILAFFFKNITWV